MKVVTPQQMTKIESKAYRGGASESDFMEEAGSGVALVAHDYVEKHNLERPVVLLCGKGNNAGDAYVAGLHLLHLEYDVIAYQLFPISECSNLCRQHHFHFINAGGRVEEITSVEQLELPKSGIIIDGIFGTGFHGDVEEPIASIITEANQSHLPIIAVDIPSGLNGETGEASEATIIANITAFLGLPKMGFFLLNGWNYVGNLVYVDFGLPREYVDEAPVDMHMLSPDILKPLMPPLVRKRHKYQAGHVVGLAGSIAFPGAALLASLSALCSGAGIVHLLYPEGMESELAAVPYELIKVRYKPGDAKFILESLNKANANFIGPGIGLSDNTKQLILEILPKLTNPCVLDADVLTILSENKCKLPQKCILTPHLGELKRLLKITGDIELSLDFLKKCQAFAKEKKVTLVVKGGPTFILQPNEPILVNPKGDPGMATAGSGDVLTGLLGSLMAQGLTTYDAAALGVYIHGFAGERAATELTSYCMTASDIITYYPDAFRPSSWTE